LPIASRTKVCTGPKIRGYPFHDLTGTQFSAESAHAHLVVLGIFQHNDHMHMGMRLIGM
jgi:hypothetical protein